MTLVELGVALEQVGVPVAYNHFKSPQELPFICYLETGTNNLNGDNKVFHKILTVDIELYTEDKDEALEMKIETVLDEQALPWEHGGAIFIEDENMYQTVYSVTLI